MSHARDGRHQNLVAKAARQGNGALSRPANGRKLVVGTKPGRTEPMLALLRRCGSHRQAPARFARARPDSPALRPLHSISFHFRRSPVRLAPTITLHCVPSATNSRDRRERACATPTTSGRDAPHIAQDKAKGREAPPGQDIGNNRESGHFPTAPLRKLRFADRKTSALTPKYRQWADTSAISLRARLRCRPCCPCRTPPDAPPDFATKERFIRVFMCR
jgi:hypothetical protein